MLCNICFRGLTNLVSSTHYSQWKFTALGLHKCIESIALIVTKLKPVWIVVLHVGKIVSRLCRLHFIFEEEMSMYFVTSYTMIVWMRTTHHLA